MCLNKILIPAICVMFLFGCATKSKTETGPSSSAAEASASAKPKTKPAANTHEVKAKGSIEVKAKDAIEVKTKDTIEETTIFTPAQISKFSQLVIGMKQAHVESLIGRPDETNSHIHGKQFRPFYFGGDTKRTEAYYKNEGQLTYSNTENFNVPDTLIRIEVNPKATGISISE